MHVAMASLHPVCNARLRSSTSFTARPLGRAAARHQHAPPRLPQLRHVCHASAEEGQQQSIEELAQELLASDPEAAARLQRVGDAARRVAELQAEQARLAQQLAEAAAEGEATVRAEERLQSSNIAAAEVAAAKLLLQAAELQAESAEGTRLQLEWQLAQDADRVESGKAAAIAGAAGTLASLPFVLSDLGVGLEAVLTLGGVGVSSLLFGVVYRYAVRQDLGNTQLKGGVVAAFGLVRGVAQATDALLAPTATPSAATGGGGGGDLAALLAAFPHAALLAGEAMLTFAFASAAVEFAFRQGLLQPLRR